MTQRSFPQVSLIIPVHNDPIGIRDTLESLLIYTPSKPEIFVVDNGSTDETPAVVSEYADQHDYIELLHERDVQGSYAARNTGIEHALSDVLVFLDADQTVTEGWLETALEELNQRDAHYLAPDVRLVAPDEPTLAGRYNYLTGFPIETFIMKHGFAPTACLFVTRDLLDDVGVFDHRLVSGGDKEFGNRVANAGYELHYAPNVVVHHPTRNSLRSLVKRNLRIGRGHSQLQQYYPDRYGRVGIPPRPSGIHGDQIQTSDTDRTKDENPEGIDRLLIILIAVGMTATRGFGYYRECFAVWSIWLQKQLKI